MSVIAAIVAVSSSFAVRAQEPVSLNLRCPPPCSFRQGESIWLDLDFTAATPNRYTVLTNYTDRPIASEEFKVTPQQDATDPVSPYLSWFLPAGSFHFVREPLGRKPVTVRMNLNQWIRFDAPGVYHVSVLSRRAGDRANPQALTPVPVPAQSNAVVIQIVPADPD